MLFETAQELLIHWAKLASGHNIENANEDLEVEDATIYIGSLNFLKNLELVKNPEVFFASGVIL